MTPLLAKSFFCVKGSLNKLLIDNLIAEDDFHHIYQPIYNLNDWSIMGYEGFIRSNVFSNPEETFEQARKRKKLYDLDSRSIHKALNTYRRAGLTKAQGKLFINVFPSTLQNENFQAFVIDIITNLEVSCQEIVLEILESEKIDDYSRIRKSIECLRKYGLLFAIDDYGKGNSNIRRILELDPDYIKLDRYFTIDLINCKKKQFAVNSVIDYCETFDKKLILEGIESPQDLAFAKFTGITYGQGYALCKPMGLKEIYQPKLIG